MSPIVLALFLCTLVTFLIKYVRRRPPNFPPGPPRLPIYGGYLHILAYNYSYTYKGLVAMSARYKSQVLGLYVGTDPTIITNDLESTRELLLKPEFQGRPDNFAARLRSFGDLYGIFFVDGPFWAEQRRFSLRHLRDFGFGRRFPKLESAVEEEIRIMMDILRKPVTDSEKGLVQDGRVLMPDLLYAGFGNAFLEVLTGERLSREHHDRLRALSRSVRLFQRHVEPSGGTLNITPWLRHVFPNFTRYRGFVDGNRGVLDFIEEISAEKKPSFDPHALRGFFDVFLAEMKKRGGEGSTFTDKLVFHGGIEISGVLLPWRHSTHVCIALADKQLIMLVLDYIFPSVTVPPVTIAMAISYLIKSPKRADRAHREIVNVVGRGRLPTLDDRPSLPYTEAILREVLRIDTNTVLAVTHRCTEDTTFRGYSVPKGTLLIPNIWAANRDPAVWERGDQFIPERFIDQNTGMLRKDVSVPFGLGKRLCSGETFSRQNMFLYLAALLQNFSFSVPEGGYLPSEDDMIPGILVTPKSFWVRFEEREQP